MFMFFIVFSLLLILVKSKIGYLLNLSNGLEFSIKLFTEIESVSKACWKISGLEL